MAKLCKDIIFGNKRLGNIKSGNKSKYIFVDFSDESDIPLGLDRDIEKGETNRYRDEANYFYDTWSDGLPLEFNIIKNPEVYTSQLEMEITKDEIREITRWLTSSHLPKWLEIEYCENESESDAVRYKGWFNNIENWVVAGTVYGLKLHFKCTTSFAYTNDMINETVVSSYKNMLVNNNSDELNSYCYPTVYISPKENGYIYICNLSDCNLLKNGILTMTGDSYFDSLCDIVDAYGRESGNTVEYAAPPNSDFNIVPICNDTAVQFYLIDIYGNRKKCTAFYMEDTKEYRIIESGFMYIKVYRNLDVYMDCKNLIITDASGRMVTYDKLGINDVDMVYWLRLINGNNSLLLYGNSTFKITHIESRKVGA